MMTRSLLAILKIPEINWENDERRRIRRKWWYEAEAELKGIKPYYGTLYFLKDMPWKDKVFYLSETEFKEYMEQKIRATKGKWDPPLTQQWRTPINDKKSH